MTVFEKIRADWKAARLSGDRVRATALGTLVGEIQTQEKKTNPARTLRDDEVLATVRKFAANAQETAQALQERGRSDEARASLLEAEMFSAYIPAMMTEQEIIDFARTRIASGAKNMGEVMKALQSDCAGRYDGRIASALVKELFG
jgi:uncharacterized protein YqeY